MTKPITDSFKLALAQLNPVVGDIDGNVKKAQAARARAAAEGADLVAFTELFLTGYPIEDLVLKPALQRAAREACEELARDTRDGGPAMLIGLPWAEGPFGLQCHGAIGPRPHRDRSFQDQSSELRRVRREARVCPRAAAGTDRGPRLGRRRAGLRGHLERGRLRDPRQGRGEAFDRAKRLALLDGQAGPALSRGRRQGGRDRTAARLRQSGWRPGRARLRRRVLRAERRSPTRAADAGLGRGVGGDRVAPAKRDSGVACRKRLPRSRRATPRTTSLASPACATMWRRTASRAWCSGFPAASTQRFARPWPWMHSARPASMASCCPTFSPAMRA